ncbi:MAG: DUF1849 family protein [Alphaproteobacteria bacterium]|nr:MAG: DUF1849 family protein [Alphaproteobacteria bacterium]
MLGLLLTAAVICVFGAQRVAALTPGGELASHRAIYELKLAHTRGNSPAVAARGRILYDFSGNSCDGYALQFRQVSELDNGEGKVTLSDLRSTTWEDGAAKKFIFKSQNYVSIIEAAREDKNILELPVYDGSEKGEKVYNTLTVIGPAIAPDERVPADAAAREPALAGLKRWPVTVSYFDRTGRDDQAPVYSIRFEVYENGISRALMLDYNDFAISGELTSIELKNSTPCK